MLDSSKNKHIEYVSFLGVTDAEPLLQLVSKNTPLNKVLMRILEQFQKKTGLTIGFRLPEGLGEDPVLWQAILTIEKMKRLNLIEWWDYRLSNTTYPDEPPFHVALVKNKFNDDIKRGFGYDGTGFSFFSKDRALWAGIGEAIERRSISHFSPEKGDYLDSTLEKLGSDALTIDPVAFPGISPEIRRAEGYPNHRLAFSQKDKFRFVRGYSVTDEKLIWIPLQLVSFRHHQDFEEPLLRSIVSSGAATHITKEKALLGGILELIERDAFMISWLNELSPEYLELDENDSELKEVVSLFKRYRIEYHAVRLSTDFAGVHVVVGIAIDRSGVGPAVCIGASAKFDLKEAILAAFTEMAASRYFIRMAYETAKKEKIDLNFPNRKEIGRDERLLYWCVPERIPKIDFFLKGVRHPFREYAKSSTLSTKQQLIALIEQFREKKLELAYVETTPPSARKELGLTTLFITAPQLQPLFLKEYPKHTWGERLFSVPKKLGLSPRQKAFTEIHPFP